MNNNSKLNEYLIEYNELLSKVALEHKEKFGALASPSLNKQETVTFLYQDLVNHINNRPEKIKKPNLILMHIKLIAKLGLMFRNLVITSLRYRVKSIPERCIYVNTWLLPRCVSGKTLKEEFFRELIDDIKIKEETIVGFQITSYDILEKLKKLEIPKNYIISVGLLSILDILVMIFDYMKNARITLKKEYLYKGKNVTGIINNSLEKDYFQLRSFPAFLKLYIAKKIKIFSPSIFLYVFENQSLENAYLSEFIMTKTKTIGYQSSGFSFRFLNFFPSKIDAETSLFPNKILTVGDIFTKTLKNYGHYPIPIQTFAALRFNYLVSDGQYKVKKPVGKIYKRVLYAFACHEYQYEKIINDLVYVFGDIKIDIHLKFHPQYSLAVLKQKYCNLPENFYIIGDINANNLQKKYDCVIFNDNSFGIESLINGVKSFEYDLEEIWDERLIYKIIY